MTCIIIGRKDSTSISCFQTSEENNTAKKALYLQLTLAVFLIVIGVSIMIVAN